MGGMSEMQLQQDQQGWTYSDKMVCADCVDDSALADAIAGSADENSICSFCGRAPAAEVDVLLDAFVVGLLREYNDVDSEMLPYETAEGGYIAWGGPIMDKWDLMDEYGDLFLGEGLVDEVLDHLADGLWVERDYAWRRRDEVLRDAWAEFSFAVKYRTRYVIWLLEDEDADRDLRGSGEVPPGRILHDIGEMLDELGLVRSIAAGTTIWRAQTHPKDAIDPFPGAGRIGTAPPECAKQPNRMSPAGIPMFYGAYNPATAHDEAIVRPGSDKYYTTGEFGLSEEIHVVDLTKLPPIPSQFDARLGTYRRQIAFLREFVNELSAPVAAGDEHIDYVPTQVLTEFILRVFKPASGEEVIGLVYPSRATPGTEALVLDIPNASCIDIGPAPRSGPTLVMDPHAILTGPI